VLDRQFYLDPLLVAAEFELDAPRAGNAPAGDDGSGNAAAAAVQKLDIVRPEIERGVTIGCVWY
jgi:hypothetical protein